MFSFGFLLVLVQVFQFVKLLALIPVSPSGTYGERNGPPC